MPKDELRASRENGQSVSRSGIISLLGSFRGIVKGLFTVLGAIASLVIALVGAAYLIAPDLQPRDKLGATIDRIGIAQGVEHSVYEDKTSEQNSLSHEQQEQTPNGIEVLVRASLHGYSDRFYSAKITLLESESFKRIDSDLISCQVRSPKANEDGVTWRCWASTPPPGTRYIVRAEIFDDGQFEGPKDEVVRDDVLLDFLDSPEFTALPTV